MGTQDNVFMQEKKRKGYAALEGQKDLRSERAGS